MADVNVLIPIVMQWEGGYQCYKEDNGNYNSKGELVGTNKGVTAGTYESFFHRVPTADDMKNLSLEDATKVLKFLYWDRWKADQINCQSVANILVDWVWGSGKWGIIIPQRILKVADDGIVGNGTLTALNNYDQKILFSLIKEARIKFVNDLVTSHPEQQKFLKGWTNRINSYKF